MNKAEKAKEIQDKLQCNHCKGIFSGSLAQALRIVYEGRTAYCSDACRKAFMRERLSIPIPNRGACLGCGKEFFSRRDAKFCGMKCYTGSRQFSKMLADARKNSMTPYSIEKRAESLRRGEEKPCLECGENIYVKKSEKTKKFCSKICHRAYMAKRFDRQIASPEQMALPQGYDGFLDRSLLSCPVVGCDWQGDYLSVHVNVTHGITAAEFKRAAGFNKHTGIVSRPMAERLRARAMVGVAVDPTYWGNGFPSGFERRHSLEAKEHQAKARALCGNGPVRACIGCGAVFQQAHPYGKTIHCSIDCRTKTYANQRVNKKSKEIKGGA